MLEKEWLFPREMCELHIRSCHPSKLFRPGYDSPSSNLLTKLTNEGGRSGWLHETEVTVANGEEQGDKCQGTVLSLNGFQVGGLDQERV